MTLTEQWQKEDEYKMLRVTLDNVARHRDKYKSDCKALAKLVLKLSPERKEWLEKHYGEYL